MNSIFERILYFLHSFSSLYILYVYVNSGEPLKLAYSHFLVVRVNTNQRNLIFHGFYFFGIILKL